LSSKPAKVLKSILDELGGSKSIDGVTVGNLTYDSPSHLMTGEFSLSFVNQLREPVKLVYCLVVFYDTEGNPLDISVVQHADTIPPGLPKRVTGRVMESTEKLNRPNPNYDEPPRKPRGKVEFRLLNFEITE
jgi:hypothetical protein